jgi:hypothetical protein
VGALTESMTQLREEIVGWRQARASLGAARIQETAERRDQVSALCAGFARDRAGAQRAWRGLTRFAPSVPEPAAQPVAAPLSRSSKPHFKKSKKH